MWTHSALPSGSTEQYSLCTLVQWRTWRKTGLRRGLESELILANDLWSTHFAWNSYTAVYSSLCTLYTCSAPYQLFVLSSWSITGARLASVEVALTILKTENTHNRYTESQNHRYTHRGSYRVRPGLKKSLKALAARSFVWRPSKERHFLKPTIFELLGLIFERPPNPEFWS